MRKKKDNKKKYLFSLLVVSIILFTIGLYALKAGKEFQVNTYTEDNQERPAVESCSCDERERELLSNLVHSCT